MGVRPSPFAPPLPIPNHRLTNRLLLALAAFLFSTGGAAIKACSLSGWQISSLRSGIAAVALYAYSPSTRRHWNPRTILLAIAYAATLVLFVTANKLTTSANAIFLQSTGALYMLLLGPLVLKERLRKTDIAVIVSVALGTALLFAGSDTAGATATNPRLGNALAAASGLTWAITLTGLRLFAKSSLDTDVGLSVVTAGNLIAFAAALPLGFPLPVLNLNDASILLYLGVFQIGVAYLSLTRGIRSVPGIEAATILLIEPVFNPVWSWLIHNERPNPAALAGGGIIICSNLIAAFHQPRGEQPSDSAVTN